MYKVIASGSRGNAIIYNDEVLVDCGVPYTKLKPYRNDIKIVLLTHVHTDHFNRTTIKRLASERPLIIWVVPEHLSEEVGKLGVRNAFVVSHKKNYTVENYRITPIKLYHNVPNYGYRIFINDYKIIHATDTFTLEGIEAKDYDLYAIEHNYDGETIDYLIREKMQNNQYAYEKDSQYNHLSIQKAEQWIKENSNYKSEVLKLHISEKHLDINSKYYVEGLDVKTNSQERVSVVSTQ